MFRKKTPAVVFGAGIGGQRALRCLRHRHRIIAFADNDPSKRGRRLMGRPIVSAADLTSLAFDLLYIASMYSPQIYAQLLKERLVDASQIRTVGKDVLSGEYEVSRWTYVVLVVLGLLALGLVTVGLLIFFERSGSAGAHSITQ